MRLVQVTGPDPDLQTINTDVGLTHYCGCISKGHHRRDGPKNFFTGDGHARIHTVKNGGLNLATAGFHQCLLAAGEAAALCANCAGPGRTGAGHDTLALLTRLGEANRDFYREAFASPLKLAPP